MKSIKFVFLFLLCSCDNNKLKPGNMYYGSWSSGDDKSKIRYFQDEYTKLCFAERGLSNSYSFTCVPCDSLVMEWIKNHK